MSMRIFSAAVVLLMTGCTVEHSQDPDAFRIACGTIDAGRLDESCTTRVALTGDVWLTTVTWPDGHFRRVRVGEHAVAAADGSDTAEVAAQPGGAREVRIGDDRFLLPRPRR